MNFSDIRFSTESYRLPTGAIKVEYFNSDFEQPEINGDTTTKTGVLPVRFAIPGTPFVIPEQELEVAVAGQITYARTKPKDLWPIVSFDLESNASGESFFRRSDIIPAGNNVQSSLLFSRYTFFLSLSQKFSITFPTINKEFVVPFPLSDSAWQRILYFAAFARKLRYIEIFFDKTFTLPIELSHADLMLVETIFRGITEGEFPLISPEIRSTWEAPAVNELNRPPFTGIGPFSASFNSGKLELFGQPLKLGDLKVDIANAQLLNTEVLDQIRSRPNRPVQLNFDVPDRRILFHFDKYVQELGRDKNSLMRKLINYKERLMKRYSEPEELVNLTHLPVIGEPLADAVKQTKTEENASTDAPAPIERVFSEIFLQQIVTPQPGQVRAYLLEHTQLSDQLGAICADVRETFGDKAELTLELTGIENNDSYLTLFVRSTSLSPAALKQLDEINKRQESAFSEDGGWVVINIDFRARDKKAFDWHDYLKLAHTLPEWQENGCLEARFRSVVSRAYFAAFCLVREHARTVEGFLPTGNSDDHLLLRRHYQQRKEVHQALRLDRLKQWQQLCDYQNSVDNAQLIAECALAQVAEITRKFD